MVFRVLPGLEGTRYDQLTSFKTSENVNRSQSLMLMTNIVVRMLKPGINIRRMLEPYPKTTGCSVI